MFVSGFTIARNVVKADYPIAEAILSIAPLCDEIVVAVGKSDDDTLSCIKAIPCDKIRIIETVWDDTLREGGRVLAVETNKALDAVSSKADWCFYIQADECLHEQYIPEIKAAMIQWKDDRSVDGLLFHYTHFFGSYDYVADSKSWYRNEIRIIKNDKTIRSYKDAQGFRKTDNSKLYVKPLRAHIYHYGWVKHPKLQLEKLKQARKLWHSDEYLEKEYADVNEFDFSVVDSLVLFKGTHPAVIQKRISEQNWQFEHDISRKNFTFKKRLLYLVEKLTGWRIGEYRNYIVK